MIVASGFYLSFLLFLNWTQMTVEGQDLSELVARVAFLAMVATWPTRWPKSCACKPKNTGAPRSTWRRPTGR